jgi:hypothetical protein
MAAIVIRSFGAAQALGRPVERVTAAVAAPTDFERKLLRFIMSSYSINRDFPYDFINGNPSPYETSFYLNDLDHANIFGGSSGTNHKKPPSNPIFWHFFDASRLAIFYYLSRF